MTCGRWSLWRCAVTRIGVVCFLHCYERDRGGDAGGSSRLQQRAQRHFRGSGQSGRISAWSAGEDGGQPLSPIRPGDGATTPAPVQLSDVQEAAIEAYHERRQLYNRIRGWSASRIEGRRRSSTPEPVLIPAALVEPASATAIAGTPLSQHVQYPQLPREEDYDPFERELKAYLQVFRKFRESARAQDKSRPSNFSPEPTSPPPPLPSPVLPLHAPPRATLFG